MNKDQLSENLQSDYQWEDMRESILKTRYPNLWEEYKDE